MSDVTPPPPPPPPPPAGYGAPATGVTPPLAEIGPRVIAFLIDVGIMVGGYIVVLIVGSIFGAVSDALGLLVLLLGWLALGAFTIYNFYYLEGTTGQTIGKKQQGIKVVGLENGGQPIGAVMAFVRYFINGLVCSLGWLLAFFDTQRQTLGDKVTKSVTVTA
jgi:uncharacterized RDD family membrane protein YckC